MSHQVAKVKREVLAPCMTCPVCEKLFRDATTIIECLHTFCRKCIYKKLSDEEMESCPVCNIDLGPSPLEKLRADHNLQDVRAKLFPSKSTNVKAPEPEVVAPAPVPAIVKRKERSLSSLVVNTPRVASQSGMTGRRSKLTARKASRGPSFTIEKPFRKDDDSTEDQPESSSSPDTSNKYSQNMRQNSTTTELSNQCNPDKRRGDGSSTWEGKVDLWKPLNCLVEAANRSKQGSVAKSDALYSHDDVGLLSKSKSKDHKFKSKIQDDRNASDGVPSETEKPKKTRRSRPKAHDFGIPPQTVLDASSSGLERRNCPIWFSLIAMDEQEAGSPPLPQISAKYLRVKDGNMPASYIQKYLKSKLDLKSEDEVDVKCMGQSVLPSLSLSNLLETWLQTAGSERITTTVGSSAMEYVMVLGYARKLTCN